MKRIDLTGQKFGRLKVLSYSHTHKSPNGTSKAMWECKCECGTTSVVWSYALRKGMTRSCGCLLAESTHNVTHGMSDTGTYQSWRGMVSRCTNLSDTHYPHYGGRGIKISDEMRTFDGFLKVMGKRPEGCSIERIDVDGDYVKENCYWLPNSQQQRNTRRSWRIKYLGSVMCLKEYCDTVGLNYMRVKGRLRIGWEPWRALELNESESWRLTEPQIKVTTR